jgi:uncharacterized protein YjbI with pentapeptide repeats
MQLSLSLDWIGAHQRFGGRHQRWTSRRAAGLGAIVLLAASLMGWSAVQLLRALAMVWTWWLVNSPHLMQRSTLLPAIELTTALSLGLLILWSINTRRTEQISNEYAQAIAQLKDEKLETRLEGVYTLGRLAKTARKQPGTIPQTLASFVQAQSPLHARGQQPIAADLQAALTILSQPASRSRPLPLLPSALVTWLSSASRSGKLARLFSWARSLLIVPLNQATPLNQLTLGLTNLGKLRLHNANFQCADLYKVNLQTANLYRANLQQTDLQSANLQQANLYRANLRHASLQYGQLQHAFLPEADLQQANLYRANFQQADLQQVNLRQAGLQNANLQQANLQGSNLQDAFLPDANLQAANLHNANLQGAFLYGTNLQDANLQGANLQHATGLTPTQLQQAKLCRTTLPDGSISDRDCLAGEGLTFTAPESNAPEGDRPELERRQPTVV